jgi:hypothetical protein
MKALFLALTLCACACAPIHHPPLRLKGPMIAPLDHVNCRAVNNGKYRNSGCVA